MSVGFYLPPFAHKCLCPPGACRLLNGSQPATSARDAYPIADASGCDLPVAIAKRTNSRAAYPVGHRYGVLPLLNQPFPVRMRMALSSFISHVADLVDGSGSSLPP